MAQTKDEREACRVLTPKFRVSYPHVFAPHAMDAKSKKSYSITMLFPKDTDLAALKKAMRNAKIQKYGDNPAKWPKDLKSPVTDGDAPKHADKEGYAGHWAIKATSSEDQKPGVVDQNVQPILNQADFYPGCYARAYLLAYIWDNQFGRGVGFILDHVQKLGDGKSFGGKKPADQVFSPVAGADDDSDEFESAQNESEMEENFL